MPAVDPFAPANSPRHPSQNRVAARLAAQQRQDPPADPEPGDGYDSMTVAQLEDVLRGRELPHTGVKADLIARLREADAQPATPESTPEAPVVDELDAALEKLDRGRR